MSARNIPRKRRFHVLTCHEGSGDDWGNVAANGGRADLGEF